MESRIEEAVGKKKLGLNCAQAVACTYCDLVGIDEQTMQAITQPFGVGIGATLEGTCGAVTGACMIIGLLNKDSGRRKSMTDAKQLLKNFQERNSTVTCKELKGIGTGAILRECNDCVRDAAEFLEKILEDTNANKDT